MVQKNGTEGKKWMRVAEGAEQMSMGLVAFKKLARESKATYKVGKIILVNMDILEEHLEKNYRENKN